MELIGEKEFKKLYDIKLGIRDPDQCTDEELLAGAIPKIWIKELEIEFKENLFWQQFTGTGKAAGVVRKDELIRERGDQIYINKLKQLKNAGDLGVTHTLEGNEEQLDLSRVAFKPDRKGNAVCWDQILGQKVSFAIETEARNLLADWAATKVDTMHFNAAYLSSNVVYGGGKASRNALTTTDTFDAELLKEISTILAEHKAATVGGIPADYVGLISAGQAYDLFNDPMWIAAQRYAGSEKIFKARLGDYMGITLFRTGQVQTVENAASPSETVHRAVFFGARALGAAWGQPWDRKNKISSYGEQKGIGLDCWLDIKILNPEYLVIAETCATARQI